MKIKEIKSSKTWKKFLEEANYQSFLQTWQWGEFQKSLGNEILKLGVVDKSKHLLMIALVIKHKVRRGKFLFIPHGPVFKQNLKDFKKPLDLLLKYLKKIAKNKNFWFIRIAPIQTDSPYLRSLYREIKMRLAPIYMHAEKMWVLNLEKSEEEILGGMRKTTRYLIRKAPKQGLIVEKRNDNQALETFWELYLQTAKREKFVPFSKDYLQKEFEAFRKKDECLWFLAKLKNQYLAGALIIFTKFAAFYHQGASIHTPYPASYLLQWEAIKEAKKRGCQFYNFWGIFQKGRTPKSWQGLTLFKIGFGGQEMNLLPTYDLVVSWKYYFTWIWEKWLNLKRGV
jgi:lipid II:glycine glycyltransferase (peptidoglycan interpeptide bridge formation enzyme)